MSMKFLKMMVLVIVAALGLTACGGGGGGGGTVTPPPTPSIVPDGVGAVAGANKVTVSWNAVTNATSYKIYYGTSAGLTKANAIGTVPIANISYRSGDVTGLVGGIDYYFGVTATVNGAESDLSTVVTAQPITVATPAYVIAAPANSKVTLTWGAVTNATYKVYYSVTSGIDISDNTTYSGVANVPAGTTTYQDTPGVNSGLSNDNPEYYVVTAIVGGVESVPTDEVSAVPSTTPAPAAPAGVRANTQNILGSIGVYVSWIPDSSATSYNVYWYKAGLSFDPTQKLAGVTTSANNTNITKISGQTTIKASIPGMTQADLDGGINFVVTAVNGNGESTLSPEALAFTPVFTDYLISGKTVTYTDDVSGAGAVTFFCNTDGTTTMLKSNLVLPINGANVAVPGTGAGTWSTNGGDLTLTFANGTTISVYFGSIILSEGIAYVSVDSTNMTQRNGTLTFQ